MIDDYTFGFAHIPPTKSGLKVSIWSGHAEAERKPSKFKKPWLMIGRDLNHQIPISIEAIPQYLINKSTLSKSDLNDFQSALDFVGRNYYLFLKHYNDVDFDYGDEELFNDLIANGEYVR